MSPVALPVDTSGMSMLTERAHELGELHAIELHHTRRQLGWLAHHRTTVGLSPAERTDYCRLAAREQELLRLAG